jgi:hypothetical protein
MSHTLPYNVGANGEEIKDRKPKCSVRVSGRAGIGMVVDGLNVSDSTATVRTNLIGV